MPKGDVPREWYSPTQPFPTKPPAYDRQGLPIEDLIDFTPELRAEAVQIVSKYRIGPIFTPPVVSKADGPLATLAMATAGGGTNWPGGSFDPETQILYVSSSKIGQPARPRAAGGSEEERHGVRAGQRRHRHAHRAWRRQRARRGRAPAAPAR